MCYQKFPKMIWDLKLEAVNLDKNRAELVRTSRIFKAYGLIISFYSYILMLKNRYHLLLCTCITSFLILEISKYKLVMKS